MCLWAFSLAGGAATEASGAQKAVLVTGASTGIGRNLVQRLASDGYFVYACARKEADLKALGALKGVQAVRLDVTSPQDISAAVETVTKGGRGLYALVNNAGVATYGSLADMKESEFDLVMAVNVYGPYRVTKAFAPLLIAQKGRITTIGSIAGILAGPQLSAYSMSKHAMEAFADSLAAQMEPLGVQVSIVEPGNYNSDIEKSVVNRIGGDMKEADRSEFKEPDEVSDAVVHALFDASPKRRYLVVPNQGEAERTIKKQILQLAQLNEGQPYTYQRDALIRMLDEALANARPRTGVPIDKK
jgi:NAD(P)-dependent dehydrogenase (short-subunit alcohol dehydrogenase family)